MTIYLTGHSKNKKKRIERVKSSPKDETDQIMVEEVVEKYALLYFLIKLSRIFLICLPATSQLSRVLYSLNDKRARF